MTTKILVIDDDKFFRTLIETFIKAFDKFMIVDLAESGEEGLKICHRSQHNLIFVDMLMPGLSGEEFLEKFRQDDLETPVILVSGNEHPGSQGFFKILVKPIFAKDIREILERLNLL